MITVGVIVTFLAAGALVWAGLKCLALERMAWENSHAA